ncbi:hypothetical protein CC78DRAFT_169693 [Lojkania enalia]|uniref:PH domain-containing protein n=1 Tax=Lojkania enalia TaxID=147567 RepID=A0A9P4N5C9_9PLEO|nr:hypothetical protein CC78DRAFT_169693 [Didymosphaeria enalia]
MAHDTHSTSRWRRNRSSANLLDQMTQQQVPTPANAPASKPAPKLERSASKMSLFNLFSKPKVEKARGHTEVGLAIPMEPQPQPQPKPAPASPPKSALRVNPPPAAQQVHRSRSAQMLRPMSMRPSVKRQQINWDPPPLFQAYPQSIKYATVQACVFSPDVLMRTQSQRRQYDLIQERVDSHRDLASTLENSTEPKKLEKSHKRLISSSVLNAPAPQLTSKIYVLVTSGYILQYSDDGPFDRLPEKILKLGMESAAFACDLIPGKHWVLQISQSANEDGTVANAPKTSLLARLRSHNSSARKTASSFLLVLENAEEMDSWLTAVRKEIDSLGGMKARDECITEQETEEKTTPESVSHRYLVQRDPKRVTKVAPVDSPLQSQYDSPRIVASDWEGDRQEKTVSITDTSSVHSSRHSTKRRSVEASSIATTAISTEQLQLDQLRERSRFSYMSSATSVSGTATRNTSRNSSPAPTSPLKEGFSPAEAEIKLRSFHMQPNQNRRSMQLLPITNEDNSVSAGTTSPPKRHSIYGPTSPTAKSPEQEGKIPTSTPLSATPSTNPIPNVRLSVQYNSHTPVRSSVRSSSAPPTRNVVSPPPSTRPPPPPTRPQSTIGALSGVNAISTHTSNRLSHNPKPFLRPFPVRPQNADSSVVVPRRQSSLGPPPIPLGVVVNRSVTTPVQRSTQAPSTASTASTATTISSFQSESTPTTTVTTPSSTTTSSSMRNLPFEFKMSTQVPSQFQPQSSSLRRPTSVQVRSDPAPFLSSRSFNTHIAPVRAISSTPSFVPGNRASMAPTLHSSPSVGVLRGQGAIRGEIKGVTPRRSMPAMGLPPPAPPPNMPLPPPPPNMALPPLPPPGVQRLQALRV